ncbi:uncharacterized protein A1O9_09019 [Exophiala aquamarina CBS 119918]|uniref:WW domain-containing protein n=1 Tax=Exophiala aquamarina CBS 119918 TaxID=1182545 RepID=A0A072P4E0_9EURO|nr:uncharacterized protein A1O9_09019 [Exophiala aquamarina CBS 119918]KEF54577.1 hypothetical protein A1O9_09019 [Exophiala aquamarina CBS 119918]
MSACSVEEKSPSFSTLDKNDPVVNSDDSDTKTPGRSGAQTQDEEDGEISDHDPPRSRSRSHPVQDQKHQTDRPPLPKEAPPGQAQPGDDGWDALWDDQAQAFYFFNRFTNISQWENPRIPTAAQSAPAWVKRPGNPDSGPTKRAGGYDPSIHGDYDPNADYAKVYETESSDGTVAGIAAATNSVGSEAYAATASFNRFTGKWQRGDVNPENFSDEQKSRRQMNAFFDVDAAANSHDGRSLRAERANKKLSKAELKAFKDKRREKKEEKRRAWLRD